MSELGRREELMLLFLSPANPMWVAIYGPKLPKMTFYGDVVGKSSKPHKWGDGKSMADNTPEQVFSRVEKLISGIKSAEEKRKADESLKLFRAGFNSNSAAYDIVTASVHLKIPTDTALDALEEIRERRQTVLPSLFYKKSERQTAEVDFEEHRGAWAVYLLRKEPRRPPMFLAGTLHVRALAPIQAVLGLRVTLHIPIIDMRAHTEWFKRPRHPWFRYTGFLHVRGDHLVLKCRYHPDSVRGGDMRPDEFDAIFDDKGTTEDGATEFRGNYLTMGQGASRESIADKLVMQLIARDDAKEVEHVMQTPHVVTEPVELAYVEGLFGGERRKKVKPLTHS